MKRVAMSVLFALLPAFAGAGEPESPKAIYRGAMLPVQFDVSPPLRSITLQPIVPGPMRELPERGTGNEGPVGPPDRDPVVQSTTSGAGLEIPSPIVSFNGPANISNVSPPDPVGDVGPNHYVAMSNLSFQIFSKTGTSLLGPALNNTLWSGFGGDCQTDNSGDPIVVHDQFADRWILTQFTASGPTFFVCIAISTTPDPTGTYFRYALSTGGNFPDYPKLGVGTEAYFFSTREFVGSAGPFAGVGAYAVNRAQLLAGNPAPQVISFLVPPGATPYNIGDGLLPADVDGFQLPPAGRPHYFMGTMDFGGPYGAPQDALTLWKFAADFAVPANSTFTFTTIPVAPFDSIFPCTPTSRDCIPQVGTTRKLDILSYRQRPMHRLAYRNFGTHESLVTNQSVEAGAGIAGLRWYEVRSPNSSPVVFQQGTFAPGLTDGIHRWMGSIAMDADGNMGLGYSASNASMFPSVWYTGRLAGDPLGTMPQGEGVIINGTGSQTGSSRWGDYTSMNVDPVDDCTFWYVNQYVPVTSSIGWQMRIGSFKFPSCTAPKDSIGLYNPSTQTFFLRNSNDSGPADLAFGYGFPTAVPIKGDWNGDGIDTIGVYQPSTGAFFLRNSNTPGPADITFQFGAGGAVPLAGDWNGDGVDTIGLYIPATGTFFLRNSNSGGVADITFTFGAGGAGQVPITGDWDNNGTDTIGLYIEQTGVFFLRNSNSAGAANLTFTFGPGGTGRVPIAGDWDDDGTDTIGLYVVSSGVFFLKNTNSSGAADMAFTFGGGGAVPLAGNWDGLP